MTEHGQWVEIIHNCSTPSVKEVEETKAQVGSIWQCDSKKPECHDKWKLRQIKHKPGNRDNVGTWPKWDRLTINGKTTHPTER